MIGASINAHPQVGREAVQPGHEGRGRAHAPRFHLPRAEETAFPRAGVKRLQRATGVRPRGLNARRLQFGPNTLSILTEPGLTCPIDDPSRDESFIAWAKQKPGVWLARRDESAGWAPASPLTPQVSG